jgi:hypothetical protein
LKGPVEGLNGRSTGGWQGSQLSGANVLKYLYKDHLHETR